MATATENTSPLFAFFKDINNLELLGDKTVLAGHYIIKDGGFCNVSATLIQQLARKHKIACNFVMGSLGFCKVNGGIHWEYGGADYKTVNQFRDFGGFDGHCWCELPMDDGSSIIIDICTNIFKQFNFTKKNVKRVGGCFIGSKNDMIKKHGLCYLSAPKNVQDYWIANLKKQAVSDMKWKPPTNKCVIYV